MAESSTKKKEDSLEESLSSEEWTIIDQKESKVDNASDEEGENKSSDLAAQETVISEDAPAETQGTKTEIEHSIEEGEEAGEKDVESDGVSILSDESESEQLVVEEGRIEKIEWQVDRQSNEDCRALIPNVSLGENTSSPHALISSTCLICSLVVVTLAIVIAGRVAHLKGDVTNYAAHVDVTEKLKELAVIEEKLKELSDVKKALDQIRISMPEMKKLKDQLASQKSEKNKFKYSLEDYKNFENLNKQNIFNSNIKNDRLEMLEATYANFCSIMSKVNSSNAAAADVENDDLQCRTPKILSDMITFKKNLQRAFKNTEENAMPDKRMFVDAGRKLDVISESLLSEFSTMFARFSFKMQERLNKFGYKLHQRLCLLNDFEKSDDKFLNILLDDDFFINNCNATADPIAAANYRSNTSHSKKQKYRGETKNEKNDYKNDKAYKKFKDSKEEYTNTSEGEHAFDDMTNAAAKSKGEIKHDDWKKNEKAKYHYVENKFKKNDKFEETNKNDYSSSRHKRESKSEYDKSFEKIEINQEYNKKNAADKNNKKDEKLDRKQSEYKKSRDYEFEQHNKDADFHQVHHSREDHEHKFESKKDHGYGNQHELKRNGEFENNKFDKKKTRRHDEDMNDDSKFIIKMDNGVEDNVIKNNHHERQRYKSKEYVLKPENFKESKYAKYDNQERRDRKDKYPTGEWQMQRGKAREKQRNSDWYFVRADSRQKARSSDEVDETEQEERTIWRSTTRPNSKNRGDNLHSRDKQDSFRGRVMRKVGRTWDFLNQEIRDYF